MTKVFVSLCTICVLAVGCATLEGDGGGIDTRPIAADGTRLNRIPGTGPISIPAGLSDVQVLNAVEQTIKGTGAGDRNIYWVSQWRLENRDPANKWIQVVLTVRAHILHVCYRIENGALIPDVPSSMNLKQNGTRIHRKVPQWINQLNTLIAARLCEMKK
ncbi:MAG: hypothetical protein J6Z49_01510 [Kiritimatiellae bacterium]|nr:hypothetical protein [Kiritimatiellia bacterium]